MIIFRNARPLPYWDKFDPDDPKHADTAVALFGTGTQAPDGQTHGRGSAKGSEIGRAPGGDLGDFAEIHT